MLPDMTYAQWEAWKSSKNAYAFDTYMKKRRNLSADQKQYAEYKKILGKHIPDRFADFQNLKYNEPEKWKMLKIGKTRRISLIDHPELALPGDKKIIPEQKFTEYLFNPSNTVGGAKGKAFTSRLGYSAENCQKLQREISYGAKKYPATFKAHTEYGDRHEQKMILYGTTGNLANVVVGWIYKPDGTTSMTTAYIKEVRV